MIGIMLSDKEQKEFHYVLRKELDEMLLDLSDSRLDRKVREAIGERYRVIFRIFARIASSSDLSRYAVFAGKRTK